MDDKDRFRRKEPLRDRPIRDAADHLRGDARPSRPEAQILDSVVTEAVGLGYDVIDTYIRQGHFAAEQARAGIDASGITTEVADLAQRAVTLSLDLADSWLDLVTALSQHCRKPQPAPSPLTPPAGPVRAPVDYEIVCSRPVQVEFQFHPGGERIVPAIPYLQAGDRSIPPLTGAFFTVSQDGKRPALNIPVPDGQPAGTYSGVIVDATTNLPGGTLIVRLLP
jgi:hypothetical protein